MLADEFEEMEATLGQLGFPPQIAQGIQYVGHFVKKSPRFTLDRAAVMMISNVAHSSYKGLTTALPICRLPYDDIWVEFAFQDRLDWLKQAVEQGVKKSTYEREHKPSRLGFWINEFTTEEAGRLLYAQPAWSDSNGMVEVATKAIVIDMNETPIREGSQKEHRDRVIANRAWREEGFRNREEFEAFSEMVERITYIIPTHMDGVWNLAREQNHEDELHRAANYDLASEWRFVLALLMLINSRNMMEQGPLETYEKLNKARDKKGKPRLLSHRPIRLMLSNVQKRRIATGYMGGSGAKRASPDEPFWTMGHFKVRRTGLYWWSMHERFGNLRPEGKAPEYSVVGAT